MAPLSTRLCRRWPTAELSGTLAGAARPLRNTVHLRIWTIHNARRWQAARLYACSVLVHGSIMALKPQMSHPCASPVKQTAHDSLLRQMISPESPLAIIDYPRGCAANKNRYPEGSLDLQPYCLPPLARMCF